MRQGILFGLLFILAFASFGQVPFTESDILNNSTKTLQFQQFWDKEFLNDWTLVDIRKADVDHFQPGIIITWKRTELGILRNRSYSYTSGLQFHSAHEQRFKG